MPGLCPWAERPSSPITGVSVGARCVAWVRERGRLARRCFDMVRIAAYFLLIAAAGCDGQSSSSEVGDQAPSSRPVTANQTKDERPLVGPPAPATPARPADVRPVPKAPSEAGAEGAANVVQYYHALIEQGRFGEARRLWSDQGRASGLSEAEFARSFERFAEYQAEIGAPGRIEGAAGSLYVQVPVVVYGRLRDGREFRQNGTVTLRRVNDVPGSTGEQRRWRITSGDAIPIALE